MFLRQKTALHCALAMGHVDVVELLVKHGAKVSDVRIKCNLHSIIDTLTAVVMITLICTI